MDSPPTTPQAGNPIAQEVALAEYGAIVDLHMHYDNINMSLLALVTAGVFVLWSTILQKDLAPELILAIHWLTFFVLSIWIRYLSVHRRIIVIKLSRAHDLETFLGMEQHSRFRYELRNAWPRKRPGGHSLELSLYIALTLLGVSVALAGIFPASQASARGSVLLVLAFLPVVIAFWWAAHCRVDVLQHIKGYRPPAYLRVFLYLGGWRVSG